MQNSFACVSDVSPGAKGSTLREAILKIKAKKKGAKGANETAEEHDFQASDDESDEGMC